MEPLSNTDKKIKQIAGFLGVLQSLTWIILSIICIYHYLQFDGGNVLSTRSYMDLVQYLIRNVFLYDNHYLYFGGQSLRHEEFFAISIIYLILDVMWLFVSINVLRRKFNNSLTTAIKRWNIITALVCLFDFITTVVLGTDYHKCTSNGDNYIEKIVIQAFCANAILPVLVIAAKGFVLWIVNFVFIIVMRKMTNRVKTITYHQTTTTYTYPTVQNPSTPYAGSQIPVPQPQPQPQNFAESSQISSQNPSAPPNHQNWNVASAPSSYQNWGGQANWRLESPKQNPLPY